MRYSKKDLMRLEKNDLIGVIDELLVKISKKNESIRKIHVRLKNAKSKMHKMNDAIRYQRKRILELHS